MVADFDLDDDNVMCSDRYRAVCGTCGKRRMVTDYVQSGSWPMTGVTLCGPCEDEYTKAARDKESSTDG